MLTAIWIDFQFRTCIPGELIIQQKLINTYNFICHIYDICISISMIQRANIFCNSTSISSYQNQCKIFLNVPKSNAKDAFSDNDIQGWWVNGIYSLITTWICFIFKLFGILLTVSIALKMNAFDESFCDPSFLILQKAS